MTRLDAVKRAIRDKAFEAFIDGEPIDGVEEYRIHADPKRAELTMSVKLKGTEGWRRYFTIKVVENY